MKRVYETPVMMAEVFEANEYVAGCWAVVCLGSDRAIPSGASYRYDDDKHGAHAEILRVHGDTAPQYNSRGRNVEYRTSRGNNNNNRVNTYGSGDNEHWVVRIDDLTDGGNHPNASV